MTSDKALTAVCLESTRRSLLITYAIHRPLWLVSVYGGAVVIERRNSASPELQLVIVVGKTSGSRNCLRTAPYTVRRGILSFLLQHSNTRPLNNCFLLISSFFIFLPMIIFSVTPKISIIRIVNE
jgi:hypothetical protein